MGDGDERAITVTPEILHDLTTRNGGEIIPGDEYSSIPFLHGRLS